MNPLWAPESTRKKLAIVATTMVLTVAVHYGFFGQLGQSHWLHALHARFCYIPIVIAAAWFGLRGGIVAASVITITVLPYAVGAARTPHNTAGEIAEIFFYFAIATLVGVLVERELLARKKQEEATLKAERAQRLSVLGHIAANVAHEIKNPLASISGAADILGDEDTPPAVREEFRTLLRGEVQRVNSTVTEFLQFARPRETEMEPLDLSENVRTTLRQAEPQIARDGVELTSDIEEGIVVVGDWRKLRQLTLNLILNASQASGAENTIHVALSRQTGDTVRITISDTGPGMSPDTLERAFEPFFTTRNTGTGLGLSVVQNIVDDHDGRIEIESHEGRGTTVMVTLTEMVSSRSDHYENSIGR